MTPMKKYFFISFIGVLLLCLAFLSGGISGRYVVTRLTTDIIDTFDNKLRQISNMRKGLAENQRFIESALHEIQLTKLDLFPQGQGDKVGFSKVKNNYYIASRSGAVFQSKLTWPDKAKTDKLFLQIPVNKALFLEQSITKKHPRIPVQFGVKDLYVREHNDELEFFASYHYWLEDKQCIVFRLSYLKAKPELINTSDTVNSDWKVLYESSPCLKLDGSLNRLGEDDSLLQAGGRILELTDKEVLLTIGDHFMDGIHNSNLVQDATASYGKTIQINISDLSTEIFTIGHRNPQGITKDQYGNILLTEHGPRGGDELNLLKKGSNYGWPYVNYGTLYAGYEYPDKFNWKNSSDKFSEPLFAWSPSTSVNNIIRLNKSAFDRWNDDVIVATLGRRAIWRIRLGNERVISTEKILVGDRIRDLQQDDNGAIVLMSDSGTFFQLTTPNTTDASVNSAQLGRKVWMKCAACHKIDEKQGHHIGPNLAGILEREIASSNGFDYSEALKQKQGKWSEAKLKTFLANPQEFAPGSSMLFEGLKDPKELDAIITYLREQN